MMSPPPAACFADKCILAMNRPHLPVCQYHFLPAMPGRSRRCGHSGTFKAGQPQGIPPAVDHKSRPAPAIARRSTLARPLLPTRAAGACQHPPWLAAPRWRGCRHRTPRRRRSASLAWRWRRRGSRGCSAGPRAPAGAGVGWGGVEGRCDDRGSSSHLGALLLCMRPRRKAAREDWPPLAARLGQPARCAQLAAGPPVQQRARRQGGQPGAPRRPARSGSKQRAALTEMPAGGSR